MEVTKRVGYCTMCWCGLEIIVTEHSPSDVMLKILCRSVSVWIQDNIYHLLSVKIYNNVLWSLRESLNIFLICCPWTKVRFFPWLEHEVIHGKERFWMIYLLAMDGNLRYWKHSRPIRNWHREMGAETRVEAVETEWKL